MCLACEQDALWFAYLESQGLLKPDDPAAVEALFGAFPVQPLPLRQEQDAGVSAKTTEKTTDASKKNPFSCDDPTVR